VSPKQNQQIFTSNQPYNFELFQVNQANPHSSESPTKNSSQAMRAMNRLQPDFKLLGKLLPSVAAGLDPTRGAFTKNQKKI